MNVHVFRSQNGVSDETFCEFVKNHYGIPVMVHEYDEKHKLCIFDFLKENRDFVLIASIVCSPDIIVPFKNGDINYEINKIILNKKQGYLEGMIITKSKNIAPEAIVNLYKGMLVPPSY